MITYVQGDLLEAFEKGEFNILIHQTNCVTKDRVSGIAKTIFEKYPEALEAHLRESNFAHYTNCFISKGKYIVNCNSQYYPGSCSNQVSKYKQWEIIDNFHNRLEALKQILSYMKLSVGIPLIASGLGADLTKKGTMSDLEYFQKFIAPEIENIFENLTVYYL